MYPSPSSSKRSHTQASSLPLSLFTPPPSFSSVSHIWISTEPASNSSVYCPRLHGIFADNQFCNKYYTCIDGQHTVTECPAGLHFDRTTGTCAWEASAGRTNCADERSKSLELGTQDKSSPNGCRVIGEGVSHWVYKGLGQDFSHWGSWGSEQGFSLWEVSLGFSHWIS